MLIAPWVSGKWHLMTQKIVDTKKVGWINNQTSLDKEKSESHIVIKYLPYRCCYEVTPLSVHPMLPCVSACGCWNYRGSLLFRHGNKMIPVVITFCLTATTQCCLALPRFFILAYFQLILFPDTMGNNCFGRFVLFHFFVDGQGGGQLY